MSVLSQAQTAAKTAKAMIPPIIASVTNFRYAKPFDNFLTLQLPAVVLAVLRFCFL